MKRGLRRLAAVVGIAGGVALLAACGSQPAARVNGEAISRAELQREIGRMMGVAGAGGQGMPQGEAPGLRAGMLDRLISLRLMRQQAKQEGISVSERDIDDRVTRIVADAGGKDQLVQVLQTEGFTGLAFRQAIQDLVLSERLSEKHVPALATIEERRVRHVLVQTADQARAARQRLAGGATWEKVAAEMSADPGSKGRGGDLGFIQRGQTVPAFDQAAFSLPLNQLSEPVQTDFGFHILQVTDTRSQAPTPEQVSALRQRDFGQYLGQLKQQARIEYIGEPAPAAPPPGATP